MDIKQAKNIMNMKVLQNHDSSIVKIIETVSHVVLYDYSLNEWKKRGIEGTLFLYYGSLVCIARLYRGVCPFVLALINDTQSQNVLLDLDLLLQ
jgi:hypothetical protein